MLILMAWTILPNNQQAGLQQTVSTYIRLLDKQSGPGLYRLDILIVLHARLAKRREILIFPRTAGNTGNSRELLVIPGNFWEISYSLTKKLLIYLLTAI